MSLRLALVASVVSLALGGCDPFIANYSADAYKSATTLKADADALIAESTEPYASHGAEADALALRMREAYEYSAGMAYNRLSARQWKIMISPDRHLFGGFVRKWKADGTLSSAEAGDIQTIVDRGFHYIICLEANKQQPTPCPTTTDTTPVPDASDAAPASSGAAQ